MKEAAGLSPAAFLCVFLSGSAERLDFCAEWIGKAPKVWSEALNNRAFTLNERKKVLNCSCEWWNVERLKICAG